MQKGKEQLYMKTIYGESQEIQVQDDYGESGGVALNTLSSGSVNNDSSEDGTFFNSWKILWTVTYDELTNTYTGGITNNGWYFENANSPFYGMKSQETQIYSTAYNSGNLNSYFSTWNSDHDGEEKLAFINVVGQSCRQIL